MKHFLTIIVSLLLEPLVALHAAEFKLAAVFSDHMVLQRDKSVLVWGSANSGEGVTVTFGGQSKMTTADAGGHWAVSLDAMPASAEPRTMTVNSVTIADVLVGDVWLCSGQSNMDWRLGGCKRQEDVDSATFPGIRQMAIPIATSDAPMTTFGGKVSWSVCSPASAPSFSAVAFYFARKIYAENKRAVPIGIVLASVGGSKIDAWLAPDGVYDIPLLQPLLKQSPLSSGTFTFFNGMIHPVAPLGIKGVLWYQGENSENARQSPDSYFLKMKALAQGWKRVWGMSDLSFYYVMIASWGKKPESATPVLLSGGWDADTRLQQAAAMALPHAGCASALDVGDSSMGDHVWDGWHPKDKLDVGERLALWAMRNDYGQPALVASGPVLRDATVAGHGVVCSFDHVGSGLMAGSKKWYEPTREEPGAALRHFVIAGADGVWHPADAVIKNNTVVMSSPNVAEPRKVSYACWQNPEGCNLYNKEGLPTAPFHIDDIAARFSIDASAGEGGAISFAGTTNYLRRMTALYSVTPQPGYFIQDVKVDNVSVGSVAAFTFDPLYANHTIRAEFARTAPSYSIAVTAGLGGTVSPSGNVSVEQGKSAAFSIVPNAGNRAMLSVDGVALGSRAQFAFCDVRNNHTLAVSFACTLNASAGYGGTVSPCGEVVTEYGARQAFSIASQSGYAIAAVMVDGKDVGTAAAHVFDAVTASHTIAVKFRATTPPNGTLPRPDDMLLACRASVLPAEGDCTEWVAQVPAAKRLPAIGVPKVVLLDGKKYAQFNSEKAPGFTVGTYSDPIPCAGASIVMVVRPERNGTHAGWTSAVDIFYDRLVLGIRNDTGVVCVRRNGKVDDSKVAIPHGAITILSLIVQPNGTYKVYANSVEILANESASAMTSLVPGIAGPFAKQITLGRNAPDAWTAFNGAIGDVFIYKIALSDAERKGLEAFLAEQLTADAAH